MNKLAGTTLVGIAGLVLAFLVWEAGKIEVSKESGEVQFRRSTTWDYDTVRKCVKSGNGSHIFQKYERVFITVPKGPGEPLDASSYLDGSGSSLVIQHLGGGTEVRLKSARPLTDEQMDLLEWCVVNPQLTWIAPEFRSK